MKATFKPQKLLSLVLSIIVVLGMLPVTAFAEEGTCSHSYEEGLYNTDVTYHYPACDDCGESNSDAGEAHTDDDGDLYCDVCYFYMGAAIHDMKLALKAVNAAGEDISDIGDGLDATLNDSGDWVGTYSDNNGNTFTVKIGENTLSGWGHCPTGYAKPVDVTFTVAEDGTITCDESFVKVEKGDEYTYLVVTLKADENSDEGGEENTTLVLGDNAVKQDYTYTYTAEKDGTLYITITQLQYGGSGTVGEGNLNLWVAVKINGTAIEKFANTLEVTSGDTVSVVVESLDGDSYSGTFNLSWDAPVPAEITGLSITVDNVDYTTGNVTIKPTSSIVYTVTGTNFANVSANQDVWYADGSSSSLDSGNFTIDTTANTATRDFSEYITWFANCDGFEIKYSNDGGDTWTGTGIYLTYDDGIAEEDKAEITGVSITVDGEAYTTGTATIKPDTASIVLKVTGTNLKNATDSNLVLHVPGYNVSLGPGWGWIVAEDGTSATLDLSNAKSEFESCVTAHTLQFSNDNQANWTNSTVSVIYDDGTGGDEGGETTETIQDVKLALKAVNAAGDDISNIGDGLDASLNGGVWIGTYSDEGFTTFTVKIGENTLSGWDYCPTGYVKPADVTFTVAADGTITCDESFVKVEKGDEYTYLVITLKADENSDDGETTEPAVITGISITVDDVEYTTGKVTITPTSSIVYTVTGTNFANVSENQFVWHAEGCADSLGNGWTVDTTANTATRDFSATEFANCDGFEIQYSNDGMQSWIGTGILLTYDDGTGGEGGEENTTLVLGDNAIKQGYTYTYTAEKDGTLYITITQIQINESRTIPEGNLNSWVAVKINGTAIEKFANTLEVTSGDTVSVAMESLDNDSYSGTLNLSWDAPVPAEITGLSITVDGVEYTTGNVTIKPYSSIVYTVTGTNFANVSENQFVWHAEGCADSLGNGWIVDTTANTATRDFSATEFANCDGFEIQYSNDGMQSWIGTGILLTYDDGTGGDEGGEENTTLVLGENAIKQGYTYTYTAEKDGTLYITITQLQYGGSGTVGEGNLNSWVAVKINGTAIEKFANTLEVTSGDTVSVVVESLDNDSYSGTLNLSWDAPVPAEITGLSITVDGEAYTTGTATITPDTASIVLKVTGTNLKYMTGTNFVFYAPGYNVPLGHGQGWTVAEDGTSATLDLSNKKSVFASCVTAHTLQFSNDNQANLTDSAVSVIYDDGIAEEDKAKITGLSITVDGEEYNTGNVTIKPNSTVVLTVTGTNFANVSENQVVWYADGYVDSLGNGWTVDTTANTATYDVSAYITEFANCNNFEIQYSNDGEATWTNTGIYLTYDDGIAEEDKAKITGVSITVDGVDYTTGKVTIKPTSKVILTVTGTNFANVSANQVVWYAEGCSELLGNGNFTVDTTANTATYDVSAYITEFANCNNFEIKYSNDGGATWTNTGIYLTYDDSIVGDLNGDDVLDVNDAIYLLYHSMFGDTLYPVSESCDYNEDGSVDINDAIHLLYQSTFGDSV